MEWIFSTEIWIALLTLATLEIVLGIDNLVFISIAVSRLPPEQRPRARKFGLEGGTAMRAVAGFGRHGALHEETFLEIAADLPVEVSFVLTEAEAALFLDLLQLENIDLFYVKFPVEYGFLPG